MADRTNQRARTRVPAMLVIIAFALRALIPASLMLERDAVSGAISITICPGISPHKTASDPLAGGAASPESGKSGNPDVPGRQYDICPFSLALLLAVPQAFHVIEAYIATADPTPPWKAEHQRAGFTPASPLPPRGPPALLI